jgi:hypothetical protein
MGFRFRLGPFTFGRTGTRLNLWRRGTGVSIPLSGKGRSFGKISAGPIVWYSSALRIVAVLCKRPVFTVLTA